MQTRNVLQYQIKAHVRLYGRHPHLVMFFLVVETSTKDDINFKHPTFVFRYLLNNIGVVSNEL